MSPPGGCHPGRTLLKERNIITTSARIFKAACDLFWMFTNLMPCVTGSATHTCQYRRHNTGRNFIFYNFLHCQQRVLSLGRRQHPHPFPVAESHPTDGGGLAAGGQSARRSWLTSLPCMAVIEWGPAAAVARDDGMKLGSCPSPTTPYIAGVAARLRIHRGG